MSDGDFMPDWLRAIIALDESGELQRCQFCHQQYLTEQPDKYGCPWCCAGQQDDKDK